MSQWTLLTKIIFFIEILVIVRVHLSVSSRFRRYKGASAAWARGVLMVKILNKCVLSILVYNLFLDRQRNSLYTPQYFHAPVYWLSSWNRNSNFQKCSDFIGWKNRLDTNIFYMIIHEDVFFNVVIFIWV